MIRLKDIRKEHNRIICLGYIEDCREPVHISVDMEGNAEAVKMPEGYEYCESYVKSAERYLLKMNKEGKLRSEMLMMWG